MSYYPLLMGVLGAAVFQKAAPIRSQESLETVIGKSFLDICNVSVGFIVGLKVAEIALKLFEYQPFFSTVSFPGQMVCFAATLGFLHFYPQISKFIPGRAYLSEV